MKKESNWVGIRSGSDSPLIFMSQLAPDLMALAFSIEAIRIELESEKHPAEAKLKDIRDCVSKMLQPIRENILNLVEDRPNRSSGRQYSASKAKTAVQTVQIEGSAIGVTS